MKEKRSITKTIVTTLLLSVVVVILSFITYSSIFTNLIFLVVSFLTFIIISWLDNESKINIRTIPPKSNKDFVCFILFWTTLSGIIAFGFPSIYRTFEEGNITRTFRYSPMFDANIR